MQQIFSLFCLCMMLSLSGCQRLNSASVSESLTLITGNSEIYQCEGDSEVVVQYYSLSDNSLSFIKLNLPGEAEITLPRTLSASGEQYSNGAITWWVKSETGAVQVRGQDSGWHDLYKKCVTPICYEGCYSQKSP